MLLDWRDTRLVPGAIRGTVPILPVTYGVTAEQRAAAQASRGCVVEASKGHDRQLVRVIRTILERDASPAPRCTGTEVSAGG